MDSLTPLVRPWDPATAEAEVGRLVRKLSVLSPSERRERSEEDIKKDFLNPFFSALGWDIGNDDTTDEVVAERHIGNRKRIDYGFRIGHVTRFYLEAKDLKDDVEAEAILHQAANYSYLKAVPWAVVSNFERTILLNADADVRHETDRIRLNLSADRYLEDFPTLLYLSRQAVQTHQLDTWAQAHGAVARRVRIDKQLLADFTDFRERLSKSILYLNKDRFDREPMLLDEVVQRLLDRLLFIRVAEDRELEERTLLALVRDENKQEILPKLRDLFRYYDSNYDSELFEAHFADSVRLDPSVLEEVVRRMHATPGRAIEYNFGIIESDVLGEMYEQYLGIVLRRTPKRTKLVDGALHRRLHGIYYTPSWVARLMVGLSIDALDEKRKAHPEALKVLDPACGSGSFLLQALEALKILRTSSSNGTQTRFDNEAREGVYASRVAVLKQNLFGVDLDPKAVEITRLNLMIRVAESRNRLPTLRKRILCGDSLVSPNGPLTAATPIDWNSAFPDVRPPAEGFDIVLANPPYVPALELARSVDPEIRAYWKKRFVETAKGAVDLYILFFSQALELARDGGIVAFITPNKYLSAPYAAAFRSWVRANHTLLRLLDLSGVPVFEDSGVSVYPVVTIVRKGRSGRRAAIDVDRYSATDDEHPRRLTVTAKTFGKLPGDLWGPLLSEDIDILEKVLDQSVDLRRIAEVQATSTAAEADLYSGLIGEGSGMKIVNTGTLDRYGTTYGRDFLIDKGRRFVAPLIDVESRKVSAVRRALYRTPKILFAKIALRPEGFLDAEGSFASINTNCVHTPKDGYSLPFLQAVLNSKLMAFIYGQLFQGLRMSKGYFQFQAPQLRLLPIHKSPGEWGANLGRMAGAMQAGVSELFKMESQRTEGARTLADKISRMDAEIDAFVYRLYDLSNDEVRRLEASLERDRARGTLAREVTARERSGPGSIASR